MSVQIEIDAQDEKELDAMIGKTAKRLNIPAENLTRDNLVRREVGPRELSGNLTIDTHRFKIGLLKIAYEFAVDSIPQYFDDEDAVKIAEILKNCRHDQTTEYVNIGNGLGPELFESFGEWLDLEAKKHFLVLTASDAGLFALIRLNGTFAVGVKLSQQRHLSEAELIFGVNDIKERTFKKFTAAEAVNQILARWLLSWDTSLKLKQRRELGLR